MAEDNKPKDVWDKAGIIGHLLAGVLIGALSVVISIVVNNAQAKLSDAQLKIAERGEVAKYVTEIATHPDANQRAELLSALDFAISPARAIPIAMNYSVQSRACDPSIARPVFDRSLQVLQRAARENMEQFRHIKETAAQPESDLAAALLGEPIGIKVRVSQVNSSSYLQINKKIDPRFNLTFGQDSGWLDITEQLNPGSNDIILVIQSSSGRLEVSAGTQQFDSGLMLIPKPTKPSFFISGTMQVDRLHSTDGSIKLFMGWGDYPLSLHNKCEY